MQDKLKLILAGEPPHDIFVRWKPLAEQPMRIRDVRHLRVRPELFEVPLELELLVPRVCEEAGIHSRERAEQRRMGGVDREPELRHALAPVEEVAPVAAEWGEENATGPHPQHRRHVLDQRIDAAARTRLGVEAEELLDGRRIDRA